jgi:molybdopterin adenylyltransferase
MVRTAWLTVEARVEGAQREESSLQGLRALLARGPFVEVDYQAVADEQALIRSRLRLMTDGEDVDLVLSCGGIGIGVRDRTPEATREVIEREVPGVAERMRAVAGERHPEMALTRGVAGVRRGALIVNLPGAAELAEAALASVLAVLPAAVAVVRGRGGA